MALSNYTDLQASVASWINRADLTSQIPDFIAIAESFIADDVRVREMLVSDTLVTVPGQDYIDLPDGWLEFENILGVDGLPMEYVTPLKLRADAPLYAGSRLKYYSVEGERLLLGNVQDTAQNIPVSFYKQLDPLSVTPTNFLLTKRPQIYLYGALAQAALFMIDDPRAATWQGAYDAVVGKSKSADAVALSSGSTLRIRGR
jgi:hypothetical protein